MNQFIKTLETFIREKSLPFYKTPKKVCLTPNAFI